MAWIVPFIPYIAMAASTATTMVTSHEQKVEARQEQRKAEAKNRALWEQTAFPKQEVIDAQAAENRGQLAQARLGSYQNLASNLASRGFGSGSGLGARGAANIERGYLQNLGTSATELTKFANTPTSAFPASSYNQPIGGTSPLGAGASTLGSLMNQAYGWTMMKNLYGTQPTGTVNLYDQTNYGNPYLYNQK